MRLNLQEYKKNRSTEAGKDWCLARGNYNIIKNSVTKERISIAKV
jgi:hypothetical protein